MLADLAVNLAGGATTTVYPASLAEDVAHILADSGAVVAVVEDDAKAAMLAELADRLPALRTVLTVDGTPDGDRVLSLDQLAERGRAHLAADPDAVERAVSSIGPESLATLIYTSGTTGRPKGVRLVHDNWAYEGAAVDAAGHPAAGRPAVPVAAAVPLVRQGAARRPAADRLRQRGGRPDRQDRRQPRRGPADVHGRRPAHLREGAQPGGRARSRPRAGSRPSSSAGRSGSAAGSPRCSSSAASPGAGLRVQHALADRLVLAKLRARFGGRVRFFVSGSAALSRDVAEWFHAAGLLILEGYGLTETSAACAVNLPDGFRFGTVGPPLPGTEVRIAADGEVLVRGPGVMRGYHGLPEQTAEALDADGWLHTGDIGELDDDGLLRITDRKKDLIKTSGGKYVAPQPIEIAFPVLCPLASQFVVHGDGRNYCTALVTLDPDALAQWATANGVAETDPAALARRDDVHAVVAAAVKELNAGLNRWETIKDFRILDRDLTVEAGELTPSLKLKRRVVEARYREVLDTMYVGAGRSRV